MNDQGDLVMALRSVVRVYQQGTQRLQVLNEVDFDLSAGEIVGLVGPSGSGKSSLLHIAGLLEVPTAGEVWLGGENCYALSDKRRTEIRRRELGFVYQFHNLLPEFSALENVMLPQQIAGITRDEARAEAARLLDRFGLGGRLDHRPAQLSGGEQQRVAIARALANAPRVILADEPTGNLDPKTSKRVFDELLEVTRQEGVGALIATHNLDLAARMDRVVLLHEGQLIEGADLAAQYRNL